MTIKINTNTIEIGSYILQEGSSGLVFNGTAAVYAVNTNNTDQNVIGTVAGYTSGGLSPPPGTITIYSHIDTFPFASDINATRFSSLTQSRSFIAGQSSPVSGYNSGGEGSFSPPPATKNTIDKFSFSIGAASTDVGDLTVVRFGSAGQSSGVSGYTSGGTPGVPTASNIIDKFPFASDANATDVGDLTVARYGVAGQSSTVSGYSSGGITTPGSRSNTIDKFPFASNANATDVGDITVVRNDVAGQSSTVSGYTSGGYAPPFSNVVDKFPFASNANATDVGDLTVARRGVAGHSSTVSGYTSGGQNASPVFPNFYVNTIDKFPFATNANATDVGDLTPGEGANVVGKGQVSGTQD
jgi:hypothetical protein